MVLGVAGILYGALLAFGQKDLKRLVAYTSVSHMGFVLLGVFAWNELALQGTVMQMLCHGISTGGLFILAGSASGADQDTGHGPDGRSLVFCAEDGRSGHGLCDGVPRTAGTRKFCR